MLPPCALGIAMAVPRSPYRDGESLSRAVRAKEWVCPELVVPNPYGDLTGLACETGGRWNDAALGTVSKLMATKTLTVPSLLRKATALAYHRRWWSLVSICCWRHDLSVRQAMKAPVKAKL